MHNLTEEEIEALEQAIGQKHDAHTEEEPIPLRAAKVALSSLPDPKPSSTQNPARWMDLPVTCQVLLGSTTLTLEQLSTLEPGGQITLDQLSEQPLEIRANGQTIAHGELITAEGRYGLRITRIVE